MSRAVKAKSGTNSPRGIVKSACPSRKIRDEGRAGMDEKLAGIFPLLSNVKVERKCEKYCLKSYRMIIVV